MCGGVLAEDAAARAVADGAALGLRRLAEDSQHRRGVAGDEDLLAGAEERRKAGPLVADDRDAARGGLEEAHARRPAGAHHLGARDVEGEALRVVELAMLGRREVRDALDVTRPADGV